MEEYIIINKSTLEKRIEELEKELEESEPTQFNNEGIENEVKERLIIELKQILSQSTPLIPEIGKAIDKGYEFAKSSLYSSDGTLQPVVGNYITNLKLDI